MMRKNFMKRLSKSASDISGCTKKTHSTSPDEEEKETNFRTPPEDGASEDDDFYDEDTRRRGSFQSSRSVPALTLEGRASGRSTKSESEKLRKRRKNDKKSKTHSEVGIRTVHTAYKAHHGFLALLKQRFSRSSSRDRDAVGIGITAETSQSANATPEASRRPLAVERVGPEIIRIRNDNSESSNHSVFGDQSSVEIFRHCATSVESSTKLASGGQVSVAEVVRHKLHHDSASKPSNVIAQDIGVVNSVVPNSGVKKDNKRNSMVPQESLDSHQSSVPEEKKVAELKSHSGFQLHVHLKQGHDLPAKDSCGTSDPYVKFFLKGKQVHKSKTIFKDLNPFWDEKFTLNIEDPFVPLEIKVYDYDFALRDDFIGEATISLVQLELDQPSDVVLTLVETGKFEYLGQVSIGLKLVPKSSAESPTSSASAGVGSTSGAHQTSPTSSGSRPGSEPPPAGAKKGWKSQRTTNVNIVLVEGKDLLAMDLEGTSDPYCKFRLSNERYKSKPIYETLNPRWLEQFDLSIFEDQSHDLEITVWDKDQRTKDDFMGRCSLDLSTLEAEKTHELWLDLEDGAGKLFLLITISGKSYGTDLSDETGSKISEELVRQYSLKSSMLSGNFFDVGYLEVKIYCAKGLYAADLGGKSDPFVVLELDNSRRQTHTEYKTVCPSWQRRLQLPVRDIHSVLYITVNDEDRNHRSEFLGKLAIPLLRIEPGKKKWYVLKDKKLRCRAKGNNPKILLEMNLIWSTFRAAVRTLNPKEEKYLYTMEKFKRQIFLNNVMRIKAIIMEFVNLGKFIQSCLEWESPVRSVIAFVSFMTITYYFEPYMFPVGLLLIFLKNYILMLYVEPRQSSHQGGEDMASADNDDDDLDEKEEDKEEKKTLKARLQAIQEVTAMVQNALGYVASMAEGIKNTFNFSVPFLSWLAVAILIGVTLVLYFISLRFLVMVWGINKFAKKLVRPNYVPNNELLDFLSRVPDDEAMLDCRELKLVEDDVHSSPTKKAATGGAITKKKQK